MTSFDHKQSAHCESGVISNLLRHQGINISEPMAFGIGAGLFFAYIPFIKVGGIPATTYRVWPGSIFKRVTKKLNVDYYMKSFRTENQAFDALDRALDQNTPVGMLTSVYYLPYLPQAFRFRFNAHNIVVFGKDGDDYLVSDPIMDYTTKISREDLAQARFAKGMPEPSGRMYYPTSSPANLDLRQPIAQGIKQAAFGMTKIFVPLFGVKGIKYMANAIEKYPAKLGERKAILYLGNIIRMQEEIGTGGAGFRFMYAAFMQEAGNLLHKPELLRLSEDLTVAGDGWRSFAFQAGRICKNRHTDTFSYKELADILRDVSEKESVIFNKLLKVQF
jgi:Domain of unknown function (DUF4872)/Butirosin biosynthesis protein H, N-terminal